MFAVTLRFSKINCQTNLYFMIKFLIKVNFKDKIKNNLKKIIYMCKTSI